MISYLGLLQANPKDRAWLIRNSPGSQPVIEGAFHDGRLTFPAPGRYRLSLSVCPQGDTDFPLTIDYEDIFTIE